jgi:hypothetical protein
MGMSIWHWLIYLAVELLWVVPVWRLFRRVGWSARWALLAFIPLLGIILLWVLAFAAWRIADANEQPLIGERS